MEVVLIAATTIDGFIARYERERSFDWTSNEDKKFYIDTIKSSDAIVMGKTSFETFHRHPKGTDWYIYTSNPKEFHNPNPSNITARGTNTSPKELIHELTAKGKQKIVICGGKSIYTQFMETGVVTKLLLTIEPVIFGSGIKLFDKPFAKTLQLTNTIALSEKTLVLEYTAI